MYDFSLILSTALVDERRRALRADFAAHRRAVARARGGALRRQSVPLVPTDRVG